MVGNGRGSEAGIAGAMRDERDTREWSPMLLEPVVAAALPSGGGRVRRFRDRDELIKAVEEVTSEECGVGLILDAIHAGVPPSSIVEQKEVGENKNMFNKCAG